MQDESQWATPLVELTFSINFALKGHKNKDSPFNDNSGALEGNPFTGYQGQAKSAPALLQ